MKSLRILLLSALGTVAAVGQVSVQLDIDRKQYLAQEPAMGVVTITNRSGRDLTFVSHAKTGIARSWLDFSMRDTGGHPMPKRTNAVFQKTSIPAGQSIARRINLSQLFDVTDVGNYAVTAHVSQLGAEDLIYTSNSGHFTVGGGSNIFTQPFGVPKSPVPKRAYNVITFNDGRRTSIYAQVMNTITERSVSTFRLSEYLAFSAPQMALDRNNDLHVLYLANPEIFVHATVNQDGMMTGTKYFKRTNARAPRFVALKDGLLGVRGAIPYDPKTDAETAPEARSATDRPGQ